MTTNFPEKLDDALIRPGRVDMKVEFALASKQQSKELFLRMYCEDKQDSARQPMKLSEILPLTAGGEVVIQPKEYGKESAKSRAQGFTGASTHLANGHLRGPTLSALPTPPKTPTTEDSYSSPTSEGALSRNFKLNSSLSSMSSIEDMASAFADTLPEAVFSPAEIQGFLLTQKKDPLKAVEEAAVWRDEELKKKEESATFKDPENNSKGKESKLLAKDSDENRAADLENKAQEQSM